MLKSKYWLTYLLFIERKTEKKNPPTMLASIDIAFRSRNRKKSINAYRFCGFLRLTTSTERKKNSLPFFVFILAKISCKQSQQVSNILMNKSIKYLELLQQLDEENVYLEMMEKI